MRKPLQINEPATTAVALPLEINRLRGDATACMKEAVRWTEQFRGDMGRAKFSAAVAGEYYRQARAACRAGDWEDFCSANSVAVTTANRHIAFAEYCIAQGKSEIPGLDDDVRALKRGIEAVMDSPKAWTALMRYSGALAKQGQYDPDRYQARKGGAGGGGQLEFDFGAVVSSVRTLRRVEEFDIDRGGLVALREELAAALAAVNQRIQDLSGTIDA